MSDDLGNPTAGPQGVLRSRFRQVLPYGVMLAASVLLYWAATLIDTDTGDGRRLGPDVWPKAIIVFMGLLCAWAIVKRLVAPVSEARRLETGERDASPPPREYPLRLAAGMALVVGYAVAVPSLGFFLTTALFIAAFTWVGGLRRPVLAAVFGIVGSFVLVVIFMRVAYISLPLGEGPFRALSLAVLRLIGVSS